MKKFLKTVMKALPLLLFLAAGGWILVMVARWVSERAKKNGAEKRPEKRNATDYVTDIFEDAADLVNSIIGAAKAAKSGGAR